MGELWRARASTAEAMVWLSLARLLLRLVPFGRWRGALGQAGRFPPGAAGVQLDGNAEARGHARAVDRAVRRLPGESRCLPQAMALHAMLRRRRLGSVLHIGVKRGQARGGIDDLHAWVSRHGEILLGANEAEHVQVYCAQL